MEDLGFLVYLIFIAVILFNSYLRRQRAQQAERERIAKQGGPFPQDRYEEEGPQQEAEWLETIFGKAEPAKQAQPAAAATTARPKEERGRPSHGKERTALKQAPVQEHRQVHRPSFKTRDDLRRAIMSMTVIGPCRSAAPYGDDASSVLPRRPD